MPCDDITEVLDVQLDPEDRLRSYALNKKSCGRAVGESSLAAEWAVGRTVEDLLAASIDDYIAWMPETGEDAEEFLYFKHFFALRMGLGAFVGTESGGANDPCAVADVSYGPDGAEFRALLRIDAVTEEIRSCGKCAGCGTKKRAGRAAATP